jgi:hypothetical protein
VKAYLINKWFSGTDAQGNPLADASLVSGQLIAQDDKYYFKRDSDGLNFSMNPPDGHITWSANVGPYELADLTGKGLVYSPAYKGPTVPYLVQIVQ